MLCNFNTQKAGIPRVRATKAIFARHAAPFSFTSRTVNPWRCKIKAKITNCYAGVDGIIFLLQSYLEVTIAQISVRFECTHF